MNQPGQSLKIICLAIVLLCFSCMPADKQMEAKRVKTNVEVWKIRTSQMSDHVMLPGVVEPISRVTVSSEVPGKVEKLHVTEGQEVRKGQLLLTIGKEELALGVKQALAYVGELEATIAQMRAGARDGEIAQLKAFVESARSAHNLTLEQEKRRKQLFEEGVVPKEMYDAARTSLVAAEKGLEQAVESLKLAQKGARKEVIRATEARLSGAKAALELAQRSLDKAEIRSPINGIVDMKFSEEGELIGPGTKLFELVTADKVKVVVWAPERVMTKVRTGDSVRLNFDAIEEEQEAKISRISFAADGATRTFKIEIALENPLMNGGTDSGDRQYRTGYIASVDFKIANYENVVKVPIESLVLQGSRLLVYTVRETDSKSGETEYITLLNDVEVGLQNTESIQIKGGLEAGEMLVVKGQRWIRGDELVNVVKTHEGHWKW